MKNRQPSGLPEDYEHNGNEYRLQLIEGDTAIQVFKNGDKTYLIKKDWCTCVGYKYHRKCQHMDKAEQRGLLKRLQKEPPVVGATSTFIEDSRRKSVEEYGKKNKWSKDMIEWALVRMAEFVRKKKTVDDMVKAFKAEKKKKVACI